MARRSREYIPAMGWDWLLPLYDPLLRWLMREETFKRRLIEQARIRAGDRVLDLGCGTATLTLMVKTFQPAAACYGLDPDPKVLAIAQQKIGRAGTAIRLVQGFADGLPYADACFDRVLSSLMLHHLSRDQKMQTLAEVRRVLRPAGSFHVVDFGKSASSIGAHVATLFNTGQQIRDNLAGRLPSFLEAAGFRDVAECGQHRTFAGSLSFYCGTKRV